MTKLAAQSAVKSAYGALIEPTTLKIQRILPGSAERIWAYLTESEMRRQWLASGDMTLEVGATFELRWKNNELTTPTGRIPDGFTGEHTMSSRIVEVDPPRKLVFTWNTNGDVTFELEPKGDEVLLTLTHRRLADPEMRYKVAAGWHSHLDVLVARATGEEPEPFWDAWTRLRQEYGRLLPKT